ncbi:MULTISPECIES: alpha/beta hydrolase [unclassified Methanoculleus]|uniref:alpha/beta hydrolase n=1 Tax=unclassified Methanoculleus TaxID=2619537 RepID=UPI0025EB2C3F|nr:MULTISPECIES: alpha/beta hydrolase [unclassified Methanoculleus]MCK9316813.1 alpha/beta hydrolase [Methanoculleus sp.]MDD2252726.1 alpha/beta hydrolase [Methanoculleus sp.]MDD2786449.1 alpha/beta hydrolase [Methanoculleus sp.]MDD3215291.1 alpha/beta hydrolase [Methanoculleus sp.]MDD4312969.1 alpha/beta hydrolase [Methanoculleus sp.]
MEKKYFQIQGIPAILWGSRSNKVYLYIHGQAGRKEEAEAFARIACRYAWQVLSIDLPEHGERKGEANSFDPWHVVPELLQVMDYIKGQWTQISLFANSIGAWFGMLSFENEPLEKSIFISPILDMKQLISNMMLRANVSETQLERERTIPTSSGQTLSWEYLLYAHEHPITKWKVPTEILYGGQDELTDRSVVEEFVQRFYCNLTVMEDGEHWFHTPEQLDILDTWTETCLQK